MGFERERTEVREPLVWPVGKDLEDEKLLRLTVITVIETGAQHTCRSANVPPGGGGTGHL